MTFLSLLRRVAQESRDPRKLHWLFEMLMESPVNGEGGSFVDAWCVESLKRMTTQDNRDTNLSLYFLLSFVLMPPHLALQSSLCAAGWPRSAGMARFRAAAPTAAVPGAQTHTGLQKRSGANRKVKPDMQFYLHYDEVLDSIETLFHTACYRYTLCYRFKKNKIKFNVLDVTIL